MIKDSEMKELSNQNCLNNNLVIGIIFIFSVFIVGCGLFNVVDKNAVLYFSLAIGICTLFLIAILRPDIYLLLALISIFNPYTVYTILTLIWDKSSIRAGISIIFLFVFFLVIFFKVSIQKKVSRIKTPIDELLIILLIFPLIGIAYGFFQGHSSRLIIADAFPILEFISYFFMTTFVIKKREQINLLFVGSLSWLLLVELGEIVFYLFCSQQFSQRVILRGAMIYRLNDFMASIAFAFLIALFVNAKSRRYRLLISLLTVIPLLVLFVSFFRSLWTGVAGSIVFILWVYRKRKKQFKTQISILFIILIFMIPLNYFSKQVQLFEGESLLSVMLDRVTIKDYGGRIQQDRSTLYEMYESPLIGKGLGDETIEAPSNYYWNIGYKLGLPALLFFLWVAFISARSGIRIFHYLPYGIFKGWTLGVLASFVVMSIVIISFPAILCFPIPAYLGTYAALLFIMPKFKKMERF